MHSMKKVIAALFILTIFLGCIQEEKTTTVAPTVTETPAPLIPEKVRVGYLTSDLHHVAYFVAKNPAVGSGKSFFEKYGIEAEDAAAGGYANGGAVMDAFAAGKLDIGLFGSPPAITKHLNAGVNTVVVAQVNEIGSGLVVANDINNVTDLQGKTVAVPGYSAIQYFLLRNLLEQKGINVSKITTIEVAPKDMRAKLEKGDIAGFVAWEPFIADAVVNKAGKILATSNDIWPHHLDCVVVADRTFAEQHPEAVVRFLRAHVAATSWVNSAKANPSGSEYATLVQISSNFTGRNEEVVKEALKYIDYKSDIDAVFTDSFKAYAEKLVQFKIVGADKLTERGYSNVDDFTKRYIDDSFLEEASK